MKSIFLVLVIFALALQGCNAQEKKSESAPPKKGEVSFEEKQQTDLLKNGSTVNNGAIAGLNFRYAAKKATPGVVHIKSVFSLKASREESDFFRDFFGDDFWRRFFPPEGEGGQKQVGSASGVIVSSDGYIVTNNHVVDEAESVEVVLHDQRSMQATIVGRDPSTDLALLKIDANNLSFIEFGNSDSVEVGDMVLAVGNPFNLASTVTAGIVSAKARNINLLTDRLAVESYIQTDAAVNPGNSGGALVDVNGKLVGINAAIATPTGAYAGYSFAIPVEMVKKTINDLLNYGKVLRGYLGIIISDMNGEKAKQLGIAITTGVLVDSVQANSAAMKAGVQVKDVITKIDNRDVENVTQLREIIARHRPGEKLQLTLNRRGAEKVVTATLMAAEEPTKVVVGGKELLNKLGIEIEDLSAKEKSQLRVSGGIKVVSIAEGIVRRNTNMQTGFIITRIDGKVVNNTFELLQQLQNKKGGVMLEGFYPGIPDIYYYAIGL